MKSIGTYESFIASKFRPVKPLGFDVDPDKLNPMAMPWQRLAVSWAVRRGRCALLEECGLGKTLQQLMFAEQIVLREKRPVLLLCPIGVRGQTVREAVKFNLSVPVVPVNEESDVIADGVNVKQLEQRLAEAAELAGKAE